jgi:hypothetical protein
MSQLFVVEASIDDQYLRLILGIRSQGTFPQIHPLCDTRIPYRFDLDNPIVPQTMTLCMLEQMLIA